VTPRWRTLDERKRDEVQLDAAVSELTATRSPWQVTTACQAAGVAAYPLMTSSRLLWDRHLHDRGFFAWVEHPVQGPGPIPGVTLRVGDDGARVRGAAPLMGEHNEEVFRGLLGLGADRYDELVASGAIY
jgi:crotonobetainyl-CoA:carnitine CoA-transferase CaiB-like acyl-CoA transferase